MEFKIKSILASERYPASLLEVEAGKLNAGLYVDDIVEEIK